MYVVTADQRNSRSGPDLVPAALTDLAAVTHGLPMRPFERTVGDEIQALFDQPSAALVSCLHLLRTGQWHVGLGIGAVETPLPESTRSARGPAFIAARRAVEAARTGVHRVAVRAGDYASSQSPAAVHADLAETALLLVARIEGARSAKGWEVSDLLDTGMTQEAAARLLGISQAAVSQRVRAAAWAEGVRGRELVRHHLIAADKGEGL